MTRQQASYVAFGGLSLWMAGVITGMRLPYAHTSTATLLRLALFVALLSLLFYFGYIYKDRYGKTGYQATIAQMDRSTKIKPTIGSLGGLVLITAFVAWTSVAFPAWAATWFASEPYVKVFEIKDIEARGGALRTARFDVTASGESNEILTIRLPRRLYEPGRPWEAGSKICLTGRSSVFGTAVESISKDASSCGAP